jgi:hypothetical protein
MGVVVIFLLPELIFMDWFTPCGPPHLLDQPGIGFAFAYPWVKSRTAASICEQYTLAFIRAGV